LMPVRSGKPGGAQRRESPVAIGACFNTEAR